MTSQSQFAEATIDNVLTPKTKEKINRLLREAYKSCMNPQLGRGKRTIKVEIAMTPDDEHHLLTTHIKAGIVLPPEQAGQQRIHVPVGATETDPGMIGKVSLLEQADLDFDADEPIDDTEDDDPVGEPPADESSAETTEDDGEESYE